MSLQAGERIGAYEIVGPLGAGGMGVVYKAIDTRLQRPVAIKDLSDRSLDNNRAQRREALAAASLDHPSISKVYELLEHEGRPLIVMEFIDGESLAKRLRAGPLPLGMTLQVGAEIAEGLANAHDQGLVHRDVKPGNVMLTRHGHVKLLDFGLAHPETGSSPTDVTQLRDDVTNPYAGTPNYMSPEQATGRPVSVRTDLFSLGVVLFECLSGELPFNGPTAATYLTAVVTQPPKSLAELAPSTPPALIRLIGQCLNKDVAARPKSAAAVARELREIANREISQNAGHVVAAPASNRWRTVGVLGLTIAIGLAAWTIWRATHTAPPPIVRQAQPMITSPGFNHESRLSPDGRWVSWLADRSGQTQLLVQAIDGGVARPVTVPSGSVISHVWSPDSKSFACLVAAGGELVLQVVPSVFGGAALNTVKLPPTQPQFTRAIRWIGADDVYLELQPQAKAVSLKRVNLTRQSVDDVSGNWSAKGTLLGFDVTADGRRVVYSLQRADQQEDLWTANVDGTDATQITDDRFFKRDAIWSGTGRTVIYRSNRGGQNDLWELDLARAQNTQLTSGDASFRANSTSPDGTLVTVERTTESARLHLREPDGLDRAITADALSDFAPSLSTDGRTLAFQRHRPLASEPERLMDAAIMVGTVAATGLVGDAREVGRGFNPRLSPDGHVVAFFQRQPADLRHQRLIVTDLRTGVSSTLSKAIALPTMTTMPVEWVIQSVAWSPDSTSLFYLEWTELKSPWSLRVYHPQSGPATPTLVTTGGDKLREIAPAPMSSQVAWITAPVETKDTPLDVKEIQVSLLDVGTATSRPLARMPSAWRLLGWTHDESALIFVRPSQTDATQMQIRRVLLATSTVVEGAPIDKCLLATARLDAAGQRILVTRLEGDVPNLYSVALRDGALQALTHNSLPGVTYSGATSVSSGAVVYVSDERKQDIWLLKAAAKLPPS